MTIFSPSNLIALFEAIRTHKDWDSVRDKERTVTKLRKLLKYLYFDRNGSLDILQSKGLDNYIAIILRDSAHNVGYALDEMRHVAERLNLPIEQSESILNIRTVKDGIRATISRSLVQDDEAAVEQLIDDIKQLNAEIERLDSFLFELIN